MKVENKTIIITDSCYIINKKQDSDWEKCGFGDNMEALGIKNYICRSTGYGDWSCTTYNSDTEEVIGRFCADAGLVAVFLLDEVLAYNPNYDDHIKLPHCVTIIPNFTGDVVFDVSRENFDKFSMDVVSVVGKGNMNFYTEQTGF